MGLFNCYGSSSYERIPLLKEDKEVTRQKANEVKRLKDLIIDSIGKVPATETDVVVCTVRRKLEGKNEKSAEDQAIKESLKQEPFYNDVCAALMKDPEVKNRLPKGARFEVAENILRNQNNSYSAELEVRLNWAPRFSCCPW